MAIKPPFKTISEEVFATYLDNAGYKWEYEQPIDGQTSKPDFRIQHAGVTLLCDVKQRDPTTMPKGGANINPVAKVRELIHCGVKQLAGFNDHLCALALYNYGDYQTRLDPFIIYGAMFGEPGIALDFSLESGSLDPESARSVLLPRGGKMIRKYSPFELRDSPQNISAVIAVEVHSPPNPAYEEAYVETHRNQEAKLGRPLSEDEEMSIRYNLLHVVRMTLSERPRVIVCINPFARRTFPDDLFNGDYDERWGIIDGSMYRLFAGAKCPETDG